MISSAMDEIGLWFQVLAPPLAASVQLNRKRNPEKANIE
jgi:hypothetical protein